MGLFFRKETKRFFCWNLARTETLLFGEISLFPGDFAVGRFEQRNRCVSFPKDLKRGPFRLTFQEKAAFERQHIISKSHRT